MTEIDRHGSPDPRPQRYQSEGRDMTDEAYREASAALRAIRDIAGSRSDLVALITCNRIASVALKQMRKSVLAARQSREASK